MILPAPLGQFAGNSAKRFVTVAVVALVLFLAAYLGTSPSLNYLVGLGGIAVAMVFLHKPEWWLAMLLVSALSIPFSIGTGTQTTLHAAVILIPLLAVMWLIDRISRQDLRFAPSQMNQPLLGLVLAACLSFVSGNLMWDYFATQTNLPAQLGGLAIFVLSALAFWLVANVIRSLQWLRILTALFLTIGTVYVAARMAPVAGALANVIVTAGATGSVFWIWLVALAGGLGLFDDTLRLSTRVALVGGALLALAIGIVQSFSWASGWLPSSIVLAALAWFRFPRLRWIWFPVVLALFLVNFERVWNTVLSTGDNIYSWETRLAAWQIVIETVKANPFLGLGPANYYNYVQLYPIMGFYVRFNSHNNYVDLIAQVGLVGTFFFVWFAFAAWREAWALRARVQDGFARAYVYACMAGLAGTLASGMLGDWFLPFVYNIGIAGFRASMLAWFFLGGLVVIRQSVNRQSDDQSAAAH